MNKVHYESIPVEKKKSKKKFYKYDDYVLKSNSVNIWNLLTIPWMRGSKSLKTQIIKIKQNFFPFSSSSFSFYTILS